MNKVKCKSMPKAYYVSKKGDKKPTYRPRHKKHNFLKNWRIIKYYITRKYEINTPTLEILLFLYDENIFTKKQFFSFSKLIDWDKRRFSDMVLQGYIKTWREGKRFQHEALYELSQKSKLICSHTYKKLTQEEEISENPYRNPIFSKKAGYMDKKYREIIRKMNSATRGGSQT